MPVFQAIDIVSGFFVLHSLIGFSLGIFAASKLTVFQKFKKIIANFVFGRLLPALSMSPYRQKPISADSDPAFSGTTIRNIVFFTTLFLIAVLFLEFIFIRNIRFLLSVSAGSGISLKIAFVYIFVAAVPINFVVGLISRLAYYLGKEFRFSFAAQSWGFISGCVAYFFFMTGVPGLLTVLIISALLAFSLFCVSSGKKTIILSFCLFALSLCALKGIFFDIHALDKKLLERSFASSFIEDYRYTPYGQNVLTQKNGEYSFFANQILMFSKPDREALESEDFGHIPALHPEKLRNILIVGGAVKYLPMIFRHNFSLVDCVEADEAIVSIIRNKFIHFGYIFGDERINIYNENPRVFIKNSQTKYDLILIGKPYPVNLQLNAYYTKEFFQSAADCLNENGFIAVKLPGRSAFSSYIMAELNRSVLDAMQSVFKYTHIIPGNHNILIASQNRMPYRLHIKKRMAKMQETTLVLSKYYLDERMDTQKTRWLRNELKKVPKGELINSDYNPKAMMLSVLYKQSVFSPYLSVFLDQAMKYSYLILIVITVVFFLSGSVYKATSFVCSAVSFWLMFTVVFSLQIYNGQIYKWAGMIASLFASGLLSGACVSNVLGKHIPLNKKMLTAEFLFVLITVLWFLTIIFNFVDLRTLSVFSFFIGFAAGAEIFILMKISKLFGSESKMKVFFFAVLGACFAAFFGGSFLIPVWGISKSVMLIFFLQFLIFCRWADLSKRGL
ncbi:MAG: hypothetical protein FWF00_00185 [Endomicrobia bacterium]|nr:hypothetical protein [Endomicrobiia bacterium]MCL2506096.1 hypothetical protein [Endomicrobiia bacterium]